MVIPMVTSSIIKSNIFVTMSTVSGAYDLEASFIRRRRHLL